MVSKRVAQWVEPFKNFWINNFKNKFMGCMDLKSGVHVIAWVCFMEFIVMLGIAVVGLTVMSPYSSFSKDSHHYSRVQMLKHYKGLLFLCFNLTFGVITAVGACVLIAGLAKNSRRLVKFFVSLQGIYLETFIFEYIINIMIGVSMLYWIGELGKNILNLYFYYVVNNYHDNMMPKALKASKKKVQKKKAATRQTTIVDHI